MKDGDAGHQFLQAILKNANTCHQQSAVVCFSDDTVGRRRRGNEEICNAQARRVIFSTSGFSMVKRLVTQKDQGANE